jgi:hypothetical protein
MSEADDIQEQIYLSRNYQLYEASDNSLIGGYASLKALKEDMFRMYCGEDEEEIKKEIEIWYMIKSMNSNSFSVWLKDALDYKFKKASKDLS